MLFQGLDKRPSVGIDQKGAIVLGVLVFEVTLPSLDGKAHVLKGSSNLHEIVGIWVQ